MGKLRDGDGVKGQWCVYVLRCGALTYCGMTNDLRKRLRQHNGAISGGGKYTSSAWPWTLAALVPGLPDKSSALKLEWWTKAKHWSTKALKSSGEEDRSVAASVCKRVRLIQMACDRRCLPRSTVRWIDPQFRRRAQVPSLRDCCAAVLATIDSSPPRRTF